jgi:hypothetical protein
VKQVGSGDHVVLEIQADMGEVSELYEPDKPGKQADRSG